MTGYRVGAFEALEWAWHMMRGYKDKHRGLDMARLAILGVLEDMGRGEEINFGEKTSNTVVCN